ncbi:MAG: hypothetical protein HY825_15450 [Acidobacteria bacterium]|nr:hypothetical protein [Acidobacteriota bacterium]
MSGPAPAAMTRTEIVLRSKQAGRALAGAAAQHAVAAVMLIGAGLESLDSGHVAWWFVAATIVVGAALVVAVIREIRALRRHGVEPDALPVVDFLAVPLLALEAVHRHEQGKHYIPWVYVLVAVLTLARALAWRRLVRIRRLRLDETGLDIRLRPFRRVRVAWADLVAVERVAQGLRLDVRGKDEQVLRLGDLLNRAEVEDAILAAFRVRAARSNEAVPAGGPSRATPPPSLE